MSVDSTLDNNSSGEEIKEEIKKERTLIISDTTYKIMCLADNKNLDPSTGAEKLANMYTALTGPIDFVKLDIERAKKKAKEFDLLR
ncbi:MAG: hypothetical protein HQK51_19415 [Oligoflexia bacterium]|nr:hypothetical protein [Oligoflexia bacterium]